MFYRLIVTELKPHPKGLIVETAVLLNPNIENLQDIDASLEDQVRPETQYNVDIFYTGEAEVLWRLAVWKIRILR